MLVLLLDGLDIADDLCGIGVDGIPILSSHFVGGEERGLRRGGCWSEGLGGSSARRCGAAYDEADTKGTTLQEITGVIQVNAGRGVEVEEGKGS